jgi:aquaporin Z
VAEFLGTGTLAFVALTVSRSQIGIPYFVAIAAGLVVVTLGIAFQRDVNFNPALTIGLWTARRIGTLKAILFIAAQLLGGLAAYSLFKYFSRGSVQQLPTSYDSRILVAEAFGAFIFAFIVAGALYQRVSFLVRAVTYGAGLTLGIMAASVAAAGFINPAVALANNAWAWSTYVLGPVLGAVIGVNLYGLLFAPREAAALKVSAVKPLRVAKTEVEDDDDDDDETDEEEEAKPVRAAKVDKASKKSSRKSKK